MKKIKFSFFLLFLIGICNAQTAAIDSNSYSQTIKAQANALANALIKNNYKASAKYTYPKITELMGGEKKMKEISKKTMKDMEKQGMSFHKITFGEPSRIIQVNDELQCTLPERIEIKVPKGRMTNSSTLIGVSNNQGKNWYFIETSGKTIDDLREILSNLSEELVIPKGGQQEFIKD